jgi:hypothetical protein
MGKSVFGANVGGLLRTPEQENAKRIAQLEEKVLRLEKLVEELKKDNGYAYQPTQPQNNVHDPLGFDSPTTLGSGGGW